MLILSAVLLHHGAAQAEIIDVPGDYPTIQGAIDASTNGDTIAIAAGTFYEHEVNANGKAITITGTIKEDGSPATTIDAQQHGRVLLAWGAEISSTSFQNLILTGGHAKLGGGMHNYYSSPSLVNCIFTNNVATSTGGGMYNHLCSPLVDDCLFMDNSAASGGGVYNLTAAPTLRYCRFEDNSASEGGGLHNDGQSTPVLLGCTFTGNTAEIHGGGMYNFDSDPTLTDMVICGNMPDQVFPAGSYTDGGGNAIDDYCPSGCEGDIDGNDHVGVDDLLIIIASWGSNDPHVDLDQDGVVDVDDLLVVIGAWGSCA